MTLIELKSRRQKIYNMKLENRVTVSGEVKDKFLESRMVGNFFKRQLKDIKKAIRHLTKK